MAEQLKLSGVVRETFGTLDHALEEYKAGIEARETGTVDFIGSGVAGCRGLPKIKADEIATFPGNLLGMAFNLDPREVGIVLLDRGESIEAGDRVERTKRILDVPVGEAMIGRVIDAAGRPLDGRGEIKTTERLPIERPATPIMQRSAVSVPLQTGIKVIDALVPVGRGQRELILGDRQTGKTAIALDTVINQKDEGVICIYCLIGQRSSAVAKLLDDLNRFGAMDYTSVVVAMGEDPPGLKFITPYAATSMGEYFMEQGRDVLVIYDDLTRHARAYRELSLLLRRPPGREAYPGDIFYIHSRMLERSTHLVKERGGGSLTALPIIETEAQNIAAYIPTNLISITDGQIYLSPDLFAKGQLPAVNAGKSVSRVGGQAQLPAYKLVSGDLHLFYAQFEELEKFSRFSARLDERTRRTLERGKRVREILKQHQFEPMPVDRQIAVLLAITGGAFDNVPLEKVLYGEQMIINALPGAAEISKKIFQAKELDDNDRKALLELAGNALAPVTETPARPQETQDSGFAGGEI